MDQASKISNNPCSSRSDFIMQKRATKYIPKCRSFNPKHPTVESSRSFCARFEQETNILKGRKYSSNGEALKTTLSWNAEQVKSFV